VLKMIGIYGPYACASSKSQGQFSVLLVTRAVLGLVH